MRQYLDLLQYVLDNGEERKDRTGVGTIGIFGYQIRFDLSEGFPLVTTKKMHIKSIIHELLWILSGSTNIKYLQENGVTIWNEWANENGSIGDGYGKQWRRWQHYDGNKVIEIDQISEVINSLKTNPFSRRHIVNAWNVGDIPKMKLPCCHYSFQFYVSKDYSLSCHMQKRSTDAFLGLPFNIASYALLTMMIAQICGYKLGDLIISFGDLHIYTNHFEQVKLQLSRTPECLPEMLINKEVKDIDSFKYSNFELTMYNYHPAIKAEVAV